MILNAIALIIQLLPGLLQGVGVISPSISSLIEKLSAAIPGVITAFATGGSVSSDLLATLSALQAEIQVLQTNTSLSAADLATASTLDQALTDALSAYNAAGLVDDPSLLTDLPTNL